MDAFIDREFQQVSQSTHTRRSRDIFGRMIAISLALHVISSAIILSPHRSALQSLPVSYLDLKNIQFPQEASSAPQAHETAQKADAPHELPSPPVPSPAEAAPQLPETAKLQRDVQATLAGAAQKPESLQESAFGLGLTSGYFSSIAEGESLRGDIREYYFSMLRAVNEKWWLNRGAQQAGLRGALITVVIARNGTILQKMLVRSSGNAAFDKTIMQTLDAAGPLPPLPPSYELDYFSAPLRFTGPLDFFTS